MARGESGMTLLGRNERMNFEDESEFGAAGGTLPTLPEDLLDRIIAMMPFPEIFRVPTLSKSWRSKFSALSSISDDVEKAKAKAFQELVAERAKNWKSFCPALFGTDAAKLQSLPSLSGLPKDWWDPDVEGPLIFTRSRSWHMFYVANFLTRSCRQVALPRSRERGEYFLFKKLVILPDCYKLLIVFRQNFFSYECFSETYDSTSQTWTSTRFDVSKRPNGRSPPVLLNGLVYFLSEVHSRPGSYASYDYQDVRLLQVFNLETQTVEEVRLNLPLNWETGLYVRKAYLVVCNSNLLMIAAESGHPGGRPVSLYVLKVDLVSLQLEEMARCPATFFDNSHFAQVLSDDRNVFMWMPSARLLGYNIEDDEWSLEWKAGDSLKRWTFRTSFETSSASNWSAFPFQPGCNPFMGV